MTILDKIIAEKKIEVAERKQLLSISDLEKTAAFNRKCLSLKQSLLQSTSGIIAEFKRKSPSKGWIHANADVKTITSEYSQNGASGISILTDFPYFGGTPDDLISARANIACPVLRKDFIIDEYQLFEAKSYGADVILLIAAALTIEECKNIAQKAQQLGLETLLEIHNAEELRYINEYITLVGVNNRNLKTFEVSTDISVELSQLIPDEFVKISESGISNVQTVRELQQIGYKGFLMGENFMKEENPAEALRRFITEI
ncbi:MAG: indole-3-glycerol phosphate synthase TrpC [Bacteroidales bacterium]|jgi:indole-3-glycerol phosphate synthase|nr:indole-3-glycerol phosphate synthase TrpC [Bacteroidales bacterium]